MRGSDSAEPGRSGSILFVVYRHALYLLHLEALFPGLRTAKVKWSHKITDVGLGVNISLLFGTNMDLFFGLTVR